MLKQLMLLFILVLILEPYALAQDACSLWSNPVIPQTGTNREFVTDTTRRFEFSFNLMRSFEAFGGHSETKGLSTVGQVIQISSHRHSVSLSFLRFNMGLRYQLNPKLALSLAIPYTIKEQTARVEWPDHHPTWSEREASQRNGDIHHRNETYTGLNDLSLLVTYTNRFRARLDRFHLLNSEKTSKLEKSDRLPTLALRLSAKSCLID